MKFWTIFGAGNFIYDLIDAIEARGELVANIVLNQEIPRTLPRKTIILKDFEPYSNHYIFGFLDPNKEKYIEELKKFDIEFSNLIHPNAYVSKTVRLGKGNYIGSGAVIGPRVSLGNFNYINRGASVGHETVLKSFNHVGPGAVICGRCDIGSKNYFGAGCVVRDNLIIKDNIKIGMAAALVKDAAEAGVYVGVPAKYLSA
jgi:sugar O-acyltransferase (sialic acid O-acetyltransferase NeuD family)